MSTGSLSDMDDDLLDGILKFHGSTGSKDSSSSEEEEEESGGEEEEEEEEGSSAGDTGEGGEKSMMKKTKMKQQRKTSRKKKGGVVHEGKQVQRNAANARERARMRDENMENNPFFEDPSPFTEASA
ncbi:hypothetical protein NHX12_025645 [Muraenolepis orangiensis]|uniref:Uncharacterized protein n=1 Tax=Muraenolepis orangiensis TaxID=630683 RepID=A0A9Q0EF03_9TELE|nr:hypothetical protein NHX12_025645 [Muraenolepis orangiensis]